MAIFTSCIAPALFVESKRGQIAHSRLSESACLIELLRDVCWVPELDQLCSKAGKSQIIRTLGPCNVDDFLLRALGDDELLLSLNVINCDFVVVG